jgi:hypothetical protein
MGKFSVTIFESLGKFSKNLEPAGILLNIFESAGKSAQHGPCITGKFFEILTSHSPRPLFSFPKNKRK